MKHFKISCKKSFAILCAAVVLGFCSCTTSQMTLSPALYEKSINDVTDAIKSNNYHITQAGVDQRNELQVTAQSYSEYSGYGTLIDNNYIKYETFAFQNADEKIIEFELRYKNDVDYHGAPYFDEIQVTKCKCTDNLLYEEFCGKNGVIKKLENITPDQQSQFYDREKTWWLAAGITILACVPLVVLICVL